MKKTAICLVLSLLGQALLRAQETSPVIVVSSTGKVKYTSPTTSTPMTVVPGAVLKESGSLQLGSKSAVILYYHGQFKRLEGKGTLAIAPVFADQHALASLNFDYNFGKYVEDAVLVASLTAGDGWGTGVTDPKKAGDGWGTGVTDPKKAGDGWGTGVSDPKKAGDGWGTGVSDPKKAGDGWGGEGSDIILILPFGYVRPLNTLFSWSRPAQARSFRLEILDETNAVRHSITTQDTTAKINFQALHLTPGERYFWKVSAPDVAGLASGVREFSVAPEEEFASNQKKASKSGIYATADPVLRAVMEASALEKAGWYYEAQQQYETWIKQNPSHNMLRMAYAAFWMRCGLETKAKQVNWK